MTFVSTAYGVCFLYHFRLLKCLKFFIISGKVKSFLNTWEHKYIFACLFLLLRTVVKSHQDHMWSISSLLLWVEWEWCLLTSHRSYCWETKHKTKSPRKMTGFDFLIPGNGILALTCSGRAFFLSLVGILPFYLFSDMPY